MYTGQAHNQQAFRLAVSGMTIIAAFVFAVASLAKAAEQHIPAAEARSLDPTTKRELTDCQQIGGCSPVMTPQAKKALDLGKDLAELGEPRIAPPGDWVKDKLTQTGVKQILKKLKLPENLSEDASEFFMDMYGEARLLWNRFSSESKTKDTKK
jgi:hypothetical protein